MILILRRILRKLIDVPWFNLYSLGSAYRKRLAGRISERHAHLVSPADPSALLPTRTRQNFEQFSGNSRRFAPLISGKLVEIFAPWPGAYFRERGAKFRAIFRKWAARSAANFRKIGRNFASGLFLPNLPIFFHGFLTWSLLPMLAHR